VITPAWVSFSLLLARVTTFVALMPIFGGTKVPRMIKVGLAIALTLTWIDVPALVGEALLKDAAPVQWIPYLMAVGREVLLGGVLGYTAGLFLVPARVAGEFISQEMGLGLGATLDPTGGNTTGAVTQLFEILAIALFLGMNGHHFLLAIFNRTLERWPLGGASAPLPIPQLLTTSAQAEEWGLAMIAPLAFCLFLSSVVLALMARAAPQLNLFSVGFSLQIGVGLAGLALLFPEILSSMTRIFVSFSEHFPGLG
jgi:flagellar biosynthesis protein FliR